MEEATGASAKLGPTPVDRRKTYHLVADAIAGAIASGRLREGQRLPSERELGELYAVGRSSTREAVRLLESRGLVGADCRGGFLVMAPENPLRLAVGQLVAKEPIEATELYEVRGTLEVENAGLAALRRTRDHLQALRRDLQAMEAGISSPGDYSTADIAFHTDLAEATGNRLALRLMDAIRDTMSRIFAVAFQVPGSPEESLHEHQRILDAVRCRRPVEARAAMRAHLARVEAATLGAAQAGSADG